MHIPKEYAELCDNVSRFLRAEIAEIGKLPGGASSRNYYRLDFASSTYFPRSTILLMSIPLSEIGMLNNYVNVDYYLKRMGIPTPRLYEMNIDQGWVFVEYEPMPTLEEHLRKNPAEQRRLYPQLIDFIVRMQHKCREEKHCPAFQRRFDYEKYMFEFDFHVQAQLLSFYFNAPQHAALITDFGNAISHFLDISFPIFVHRDFQSSNLFYDPQKKDFVIIDFQDARFGTPVYDLVSMAWDSYVDLPEDLRMELVTAYFPTLADFGVNWSWDEYIKYVDYSIIQRKLHDAGAFAYNYRRFGSRKYVKYIAAAIGMALEKMRKYEEFLPATQLLESLLNQEQAQQD